MSSEFDDKYAVRMNDLRTEFHKSRIMFATRDGEVYIASKGTADTHADWFKKLGWITEEDDSVMDNIIRGYVHDNGVYFYIGYDFKTTDEVEEIFVKTYLKSLVNKLNLSLGFHVFAGLTVLKTEELLPPMKNLGTIELLLKDRIR